MSGVANENTSSSTRRGMRSRSRRVARSCRNPGSLPVQRSSVDQHSQRSRRTPLARTGCVPSRTSESDRRVSPPTPAIPAVRAHGLQRLAHTAVFRPILPVWGKLYEQAMRAPSSNNVPAQIVPKPGFRRCRRRNSRSLFVRNTRCTAFFQPEFHRNCARFLDLCRRSR